MVRDSVEYKSGKLYCRIDVFKKYLDEVKERVGVDEGISLELEGTGYQEGDKPREMRIGKVVKLFLNYNRPTTDEEEE